MRKIKFALIVLLFLFVSCNQKEEPKTTPFIKAVSQVEAGRYLAIVGGCNDCHTNGYLQTDGNIPEADWLTGSPLGWRGPWGTTYPTNLRLLVQKMDEAQWTAMLKNRKARPPMPWMNVNKMSDEDAKAIYAYLKSLGPKGDVMPVGIGPDEEPKTPYLSLFPHNLPPVTAARSGS